MASNFTSINHIVDKYKSPLSKPKESEPIIQKEASYELKETVEHQLEKDVKPYVTSRAETIELPPDLKKIGLQPASTTQFPTYQNVTLPIADDKIIKSLHSPVTSSVRWLATLALYMLAKAHLVLKIVHGRVIRVIKT